LPLQVPEYDGTGDPRPVLKSFVLNVRDFLDELVRDNMDPQGQALFVPELVTFMREAWAEGRSLFDAIAEGIPRLTDGALRDHGLGGQQLRFKLTVIRHFNERYLVLGKSILKKLLELIDTLLKSIISALGLGEGAAELKEYIEQSIDE
jgi:hypothetical protein